MTSRRIRSYAMLITVAAIWGAAGPIIKFTLEGIDPLPFLAYRFAIASVFSLIFFIIKIRKGKKFRQLRANFPAALLYGILAVPVGLGMLFFALDNTTVLDLTLIGVIAPLLVTAGGAYFFRDRITRRERIGIFIVMIGVLFNSLFPIFQLGSELRLTGNLLLLLYLASDAGSILLAKKIIRKKIQSANLTNMAFIIGGATLIPLAAIVYGPAQIIQILSTLPFKYHLGVWYMALISGNLAYYLFVRGQKTIEISEAVLFGYLQPLFMIPLAIFWLREHVSTSFVFGAVVIAIGLMIAQTKKRRYNT